MTPGMLPPLFDADPCLADSLGSQNERHEYEHGQQPDFEQRLGICTGGCASIETSAPLPGFAQQVGRNTPAKKDGT